MLGEYAKRMFDAGRVRQLADQIEREARRDLTAYCMDGVRQLVKAGYPSRIDLQGVNKIAYTFERGQVSLRRPWSADLSEHEPVLIGSNGVPFEIYSDEVLIAADKSIEHALSRLQADLVKV